MKVSPMYLPVMPDGITPESLVTEYVTLREIGVHFANKLRFEFVL